MRLGASKQPSKFARGPLLVHAVALRHPSIVSSNAESAGTEPDAIELYVRVRDPQASKGPVFTIKKSFDKATLQSIMAWANCPAAIGVRTRAEIVRIGDTAAIPIHLSHARAHLPLLAALIMSKTVARDWVVDLPMPHPKAWFQTVDYVYRQEMEVTDAIRDNILHLGGVI